MNEEKQLRQFCLNIALGTAQIACKPTTADELIKEAEKLYVFMTKQVEEIKS